VDVGVDDDDVDIDLVLALAYLDVHLVYNLTYINSIWGLDSIGSPALPYDRKYFLTTIFELVIT
jgi:hypothetical protein